MESIFDDDPNEVGAQVSAYCTQCKGDTTHTIVSRFEKEIRSVHCDTCNNSHPYRAPRGSEDDIPEPMAARRRKTLKKIPWAQYMDDADEADPRKYSPAHSFIEGEIIVHPTFGVGYISEIVSRTKMEVTFEEAARILAFAREDLAPRGAKAAPIKKAAPKKKATPKKK